MTYSLITTLLRSNSLQSEESCQIVFVLLANEENWIYFLEDNLFCQAIYKYTSAIAIQEMEVLVTNKVLRLSISKINVEILEKFDTLSIVQY